VSARRNRLAVLGAVAALALVVAAGSGASPGTDLVAGIPQRGTVLGEKTATVTLIQFEDLGCTHCNSYMTNAFPKIVNDYVRTGLVEVDFRGLGVVTPASEPALRYTLAAARQHKLWQLAELFYENQSHLDQLVTVAGVKRLARGIPGLNVPQLLRDARSVAVRQQVDAHAAEATRRKVPGTPWFFVKVGTDPPKLVRPDGYDGQSFATILDQALGR
jgi:protein-disulfide isomerase